MSWRDTYTRYDCGIYQRQEDGKTAMIAAAKNVHVAQRIVNALNAAEKR